MKHAEKHPGKHPNIHRYSSEELRQSTPGHRNSYEETSSFDKKPFSSDLEAWRTGPDAKTIQGMITAFGEKSFAIIFVVLMSVPALPIPTGGVTHIFEVIVVLLALQLLLGRRTIWLPKKLLNKELGGPIIHKGLPFLIRKIRWLEKHSRPRLGGVMDLRLARSLIAFIVIVLTIVAFMAPPFSGLDTLPALAVVLIGLAVILEDIVVLVVGVLIGAGGIAVVVGLGKVITSFVKGLF